MFFLAESMTRPFCAAPIDIYPRVSGAATLDYNNHSATRWRRHMENIAS